ncbi:MAG: hypothetical protein PHR39_08785 [Actinomycetota bacterium]|nr:hypothetical protein [Actinomycetota bacterium]
MNSESASDIKDNSEKEVIDLKVLLKIIAGTKKWFISVFAIAFIAGILLNFFAFPNLRYYSKSHIMISFKNILFQEKISNGFPDEDINMWLIKSQQYWVQYVNNWHTASEKILQSDEFLSNLSNSLGNSPSVESLRKSIKLDRDIEVNSLNITVSSNNREDAYRINKTLLEVFTKQKNTEFEKAYLDFLADLDIKITENQKKLNEIKAQVENEIMAYYKEELNGGKSPEDIKVQNEIAISDKFKEQIGNLESEYGLLMETRENARENKDYFVYRTFYDLEPQVYSNLDFLRNVILSIFIGSILAIATSLIVNIYNQKKK